MAKVGVDPACFTLAQHFLADAVVCDPVSAAKTQQDLQSLAEHIQQAVEDWFSQCEPGGDSLT